MPRALAPDTPQALHLARLAQGTPGEWVRLPGSAVQVVQLQGTLSGPQVSGWLICLSGEAVVDLPLSNFVRLRPAEGYGVQAHEPWTAFGTKDGTVLMLVGEGEHREPAL
ncbi:hypothetical protein K7W42_16415 [Deinococcus sp. HMF7604]|uniref:hypothetical protein n=1 Tax=Deinococcus betulae TaxID=2873312 RepID=UPI001CCF03FF|nr:hypothetical protein [Deinococcus betulae]MBZ9752434.1 hypothetical protein [Deinococcus betulae]